MGKKYKVQEVQDVLENIGANIFERYSGRGMYGAECIGVEVGSTSELLSLFVDLAVADEDMARFLARGADQDSLGLNKIVYWPGVRYPSEE